MTPNFFCGIFVYLTERNLKKFFWPQSKTRITSLKKNIPLVMTGTRTKKTCSYERQLQEICTPPILLIGSNYNRSNRNKDSIQYNVGPSLLVVLILLKFPIRQESFFLSHEAYFSISRFSVIWVPI